MKNLIISLLLLTAGTAIAQEIAEDPEVPVEELRRYTVEMIIFSYAQDVASGSEVFVADEPVGDELTDDELTFGEPIAEASPVEVDSVVKDARRYELIRLAREDYSLANIYSEMRRLDVYRPLMHFGWTQATLPQEESESRPLTVFGRPPTGLQGELNLYLNRYLHLAVNLELEAPSREPIQRGFYDTQPTKYRIVEDRIFSNGDLRYFDHPKFGVLAKITRVEEEEGEQEMLGDTELLGFDGQ